MAQVLSSQFPRWKKYLGLLLAAAVLGALLSFGLNSWRSSSPGQTGAGGATTVNNRSSRAFSQPAPGLSAAEFDQHAEGDANFEAVFVTAPAQVNPGLGPLFNNAACVGCHIKDGRGMPEPGQSLVRVSLPMGEVNPAMGVVPVPEIGVQIRDRAVYGHVPDARMAMDWQTQVGQYPDGRAYELRSPRLKLTQADPEKPLPDDMLTSLRVPPPIFGSGLLEVVSEVAILDQADPDDRNQDGISGRPNRVWDPGAQAEALGRFGFKANTVSLEVQTAVAYFNDMGVTNPVFTGGQASPDVDRQTLDTTTFYVQTLGVPARTLRDDPQVQRGERLFAQVGCTACHVATLKTGPADIPVLANQTIHPYTDLLLHDMGGGLADNRPDFDASGSEWRTAPLWGLGLVQTVLPYAGYLHDGRARTIEEAVLWHDGEAAESKAQFMALGERDRAALLQFLNSL